jgi:membrane protease subunit HflC
MNQNKLLALAALALLLIFIVSSSVYTLDEREKVIVVRFGEIMRYDDTAGLNYKAPWDKAFYFDSRVLTLDQVPQRVPTLEKKDVIVDAYVKWRIRDVREYYLTVGGQESEARRRLDNLVNSGLRDEFGKRTVKSVVAEDREKIMEILTTYADQEARKFGMEVIDVRVQRVELPEEVSQSVYDRMRTERGRKAAELRAQGAEQADKIRADAERQRQVLLADAYGKAERLRGEGDARAISLYAGAAGRAPEFYSFYRSLSAYKASFNDKEDVLVLDPSSDFFKYMKKPIR